VPPRSVHRTRPRHVRPLPHLWIARLEWDQQFPPRALAWVTILVSRRNVRVKVLKLKLLHFLAPTDCRQFMVCEKANTAPHPQSCPTGYYYNRDTMRCVRGNTCVTATCGVNLFTTFGNTRNFYVLCVANQPAYVFRCPDNTQYTAGSNPPCVYRCSAEGWFADSEDRRSYYECYRNASLQFEQRKLVCPFSWRFDATARICVGPNVD
jgi:Chitin binding Peritrophin-A domain